MATGTEVVRARAADGHLLEDQSLSGRYPTALAADPRRAATAWCGTRSSGLYRTDDAGRSWRCVGLEGERIMSVAVSPVPGAGVWVGTEPSALWHSPDGERDWRVRRGLVDLPSSSDWAFPPRPDTHHVRWITCHPEEPGRLWLAIEAGALVSTGDGGVNWSDRVPGGPFDTHELAVHPGRPDLLRSAAGDGYFESRDGGSTWSSPMDGLGVGYLRSVAIDPGDPEIVVVSAASAARRAYVAGRSDGRLYRREGSGPWTRVLSGWPERPDTIAPLLVPGDDGGVFWAVDERGVHRSGDSGRSWDQIVGFSEPPSNFRGLCTV